MEAAILLAHKDPRLVASGKRGAAQRWGRRRTLRLDALPESVRVAIEALLSAEANAEAREAAETADAA